VVGRYSLSARLSNSLAVRGGGVSLLQQVLGISGLQALFDPSDLTSLYQSRTGDSTGAVDSVVGIMLDKRQMRGLSAAAFIAGQSELVTNGGFDADSGWTKGSGWTISGGVATQAGAGVDPLYQNLGLTVGQWYIVTYSITARSAGTVYVACGGGTTGASRNAVGSYVELQRCAGNGFFYVQQDASFEGSIDNVSVKAIPGYHALAPSDAARPILRQSGSTYYLDADGTDDWMQIFPTLNLGEQWWHVGGWQSDTHTKYAFGTSNAGSARSALAHSVAGDWRWTDTSTVQQPLATGNPATTCVVTVEQTATSAIQGRYNGVSGSVVAPYDDSASTQGLAFFSAKNDSFSAGLDGRFYGGAFGTGTLTSTGRALLERYVAGLTGVVL